MTDAIVEFFRNTLNNDYLTVFLIAILPIIELRGSILVAFKLGMEPIFAFLISYAGSVIVVPFLLLLLAPILNLMKKWKFFRSFAMAVEGVFQDKANKIIEKHSKKINSENNENNEKLIKTSTKDEILCEGSADLNSAVQTEVKNTENLSANLKSENNPVVSSEALKKAERFKFWGVLLFVAVPLPLTGVWTGSAVAVFLGLGFFKSLLAVAGGNLVAGGIMTLLSICFKDYIDAILFWFLIIVIVVLVLFIIKIIIKTVKQNKNKA